MELEVKYNSDLSKIDVVKDVISLLQQLSDCYNDKIKDFENRISELEIERETIRKGVILHNWEGLKSYFGVDD